MKETVLKSNICPGCRRKVTQGDSQTCVVEGITYHDTCLILKYSKRRDGLRRKYLGGTITVTEFEELKDLEVVTQRLLLSTKMPHPPNLKDLISTKNFDFEDMEAETSTGQKLLEDYLFRLREWEQKNPMLPSTDEIIKKLEEEKPRLIE